MKKDFRTELAKAQGLGSTRTGTSHFWLQRISALANIPLIIFFILLVVSLVGQNYDNVYQTLSRPPVAALMALMTTSSLIHMKLGMQVIIEDYVHNHNLKALCLALNIFFCFSAGAALLLALLKITLGG